MTKLRMHRLRRSELPVDTTRLARYLIGKTLVHDTPKGRMAGRIVETEAYPIGDAAAHSFIGKTKRNQSTFLERGRAYVYFIYGNWHAINVSAETEGVGGAALIRALEPLEGIFLMKRRRPHAAEHELCRGPGCLATAMAIDRRYDGVDLCAQGPIWLGAATQKTGRIGRSVRIGITKEAHRPLRFYERGNPCVSGPRRLRI
jgi:DNA-3-methyladenine glycosylase